MHRVLVSHGDGTSLAKETRNEAAFDLLNLKKTSCSVSIQQFGTLPLLRPSYLAAHDTLRSDTPCRQSAGDRSDRTWSAGFSAFWLSPAVVSDRSLPGHVPDTHPRHAVRQGFPGHCCKWNKWSYHSPTPAIARIPAVPLLRGFLPRYRCERVYFALLALA